VNSAGSLDKNNFYVAMRLVALAQSGRPLTRELALIVQGNRLGSLAVA